MSPNSREPKESRCKYTIPLVDWEGNTQLIKARGVDCMIYS
jgi:hypothetical protein